MCRDVVARGPSKSRRKKAFAAIFFTGQCSCSGKPPAKQGLSLSKKGKKRVRVMSQEKGKKRMLMPSHTQVRTDAHSPL